MRTVSEILEAAKSGGERPSHDECFWAMQALEQAWIMTANDYRNQVFTPKTEAIAKMVCENDFQRSKRMLAADPQGWLGPSRDYSNAENRKRRETMVRVFEKLTQIST